MNAHRRPTHEHICIYTDACVCVCVCVCDGCHGSCVHRRRCSYSLMNSITEMGPYINTRLRARHQTHLWPQRNNLDRPARPPCVYRVAPSQETSRIYVCEARDDRSSALRGGGFSFGRGAKRLDGSRAKTNFFILYAVQTDSVQLPLYRTVFRVTPWLFPQLHFLRRCKRCQQRPGPVPHYASLFSVSAAVVVAVSRSDTTAKLTYCHTK